MANVQDTLDGHEPDAGDRVREPTDGPSPSPSRKRYRTPHPRSGRRRGKAARSEVPRVVHGLWEPASDRRDPVELLEEQAASRVPELVPIRYGRMLVSPFTFYRGAAYLMAADLAGAPRTGLARAAVRRRAPVQLRRVRRARSAARVQRQRLRRDAAGPVRVGREAAGGQLRRGRPRSRLRRRRSGEAINRAVTRAYREAMRDLAGMRNLDLWYSAHRRRRAHRALRHELSAEAASSASSATSPRRAPRTACGRSPS